MLGAALSIRLEGARLAIALLALCGYVARPSPAVRRESMLAAVRLSAIAVLLAAPWWLLAGPSLQYAGPHGAAETLARLGPLLVIAPGGIVFARRVWGMNRIVLVLAVFVVLAIAAPWPMEWWPIAVPLASVAAAWVWCERGRLPLTVRWTGATVSVAVILVGFVPSLRVARRALAVATGRQSRHEFLVLNEPTYRAASLLNQIGRHEQILFSQDPRGLYFSCLTSSKASARNATTVTKPPAEQRELLTWARAAGYAYVLLVEPLTIDSTNLSPHGTNALEPASTEAADSQSRATGKVIPILEYCFADDNNRSIRYRLLKLDGLRAVAERSPPAKPEIGPATAGRPSRDPTR